MQEKVFIDYIISCFPLLSPEIIGFRNISLLSLRMKIHLLNWYIHSSQNII